MTLFIKNCKAKLQMRHNVDNKLKMPKKMMKQNICLEL